MAQHRTSAFTAFDSDGKILLQLRDMGAPLAPGCWGFFGGHLEEGEDFVQAVRREVMEEIGVDASRAELVGQYEFGDPTEFEISLFAQPMEEPLQAVLDRQTEGESAGMWRPEEAVRLKMHPADRELVLAVAAWLSTRAGP